MGNHDSGPEKQGGFLADTKYGYVIRDRCEINRSPRNRPIESPGATLAEKADGLNQFVKREGLPSLRYLDGAGPRERNLSFIRSKP